METNDKYCVSGLGCISDEVKNVEPLSSRISSPKKGKEEEPKIHSLGGVKATKDMLNDLVFILGKTKGVCISFWDTMNEKVSEFRWIGLV